ncbi:MAG TPA: hypothetical protein VH589_27875 [Trebonia sp.]
MAAEHDKDQLAAAANTRRASHAGSARSRASGQRTKPVNTRLLAAAVLDAIERRRAAQAG